ncbi:hypothetical protein SAMN04489835_1868 [Mycolicibacterium rutilum]|uniref:Uncharacterized protein n=2 Tax=Mycolicibacterium rutilum TaxID=370526 RepID=A0A1H6JC73_MYCRU|nr:hypothetical protein SAMN04489835_1868 [Mycolicibacterium rutilum]
MLGVLLAGCHGPAASADPVTAALDQPFVLSGGQEAALAGTPLRLRFTEVLEDSRCPTEVECVWTGQARLTVVADTGRPSTLEFNTNPAPGQNRQSIRTDGYLVTLQALDPYPRTPDDAPALPDYRATLVVRDAG